MSNVPLYLCRVHHSMIAGIFCMGKVVPTFEFKCVSSGERLLSVFKGEKSDMPAWVADLSYWYESMKIKNDLDERFQGIEGYIQLHRELGVCCYFFYGIKPYKIAYDNVRLESRNKNNLRYCIWETPKGTLTSVYEYVEKSYCWAPMEYPVKSIDDFSVLEDIYERSYYISCDEEYRKTDKLIGEYGLPAILLPRSPLPALLADWCGVENTIMMITRTRPGPQI